MRIIFAEPGDSPEEIAVFALLLARYNVRDAGTFVKAASHDEVTL